MEGLDDIGEAAASSLEHRKSAPHRSEGERRIRSQRSCVGRAAKQGSRACRFKGTGERVEPEERSQAVGQCRHWIEMRAEKHHRFNEPLSHLTYATQIHYYGREKPGDSPAEQNVREHHEG